MRKTELLPREWFSLCAFGVLIALVLLIQHFSADHLPDLPPPDAVVPKSEVVIKVSGAVNQPGTYRVEKGTTLQEFLDIVGVYPNANLSRLKLTRPLNRSQDLDIRFQKMIRVFMRGAVDAPGPIEVASTTSVSDLKQIVKFKPNADLSTLRAKRKLRDGESIEVKFIK